MLSNARRVPYQYTQFCNIYRAWAKKSKATMRIHHKPGDAMEVDWTGGTLPIKDPVTGETVPAYLFVGALPCSCYVYAELCSDMKSENWLLCHVHAYEYFGGVSRLTIPDNLRTGVLKNTRMDTVLNRCDAYIHEEKEFMQPLPANPYEPSLWSDQTVLLDYTVTDELNKYSVQYDLIGDRSASV